MALSNAERQARHRVRITAQAAQAQGDTRAILEALEGLTRAVATLSSEVHALRGKAGQNGGKPAPAVTSRGQKVTSQTVTGEAARAYAWDGAPAPYGGQGAPSHVTENDTHRVLVALTAKASAGGLRDALGAMGHDLPLATVTAALVVLQDRGEVRRIVGEGPRPDQWEAIPQDPALADLRDAPIHRPGPDPLVTAHVDCQAYQAHSTLGHRWDPDQGVFRCYVCHPTHGPRGVPPPPGATLQEARHGHA